MTFIGASFNNLVYKIEAASVTLETVQVMGIQSEFELTEGNSPVVLDEEKLRQIVSEGSLRFDEWTSLISEIESTCPDNIERICLVYDSFLSIFPLCYGYWRKYVHHKMRLCTVEEVAEVFEQSVQSATHCVDMWVDYCNFGRLVFEDPSDVRRLFKRAISFVGKDYLCYTLWDKYIEFEFSLKNWSLLAHLYIQALRFPTKKLHRYYENFKKLVEIWEGGMKTVAAEPFLNNETSISYNQDAISCIIRDLLDPSNGSDRLKALHKYRSLGEGLFQEAVQLYEKVNVYEARIKRSYFHVKPLDLIQLQNWHDYLDFAESYGDFNWAVQLYERCLIPCANYPEFWMRYVEFLERKGGREIANYALDRATQIHLKRLSVIHLFNSRFKEHVGDVSNARAALLRCSTTSDKAFVENVVRRANMEKRLGNSATASTIYKDAIETAKAEEKWDTLPVLYIHFSRLEYCTTNSEDAATNILIDGIKHMPSCKLLIEELVKFAMTHQGSKHINVIDSIVATAISPQPSGSQGLSPENGEEISRLYLEFVDLCGTIHDLRKAWNRHIRLFPYYVRDSSLHPTTEARKWKLAEKLPPPETDTRKTAHPVTDEVLEQKLPQLESALAENVDELSEKFKTDLLQSREPDNTSLVQEHQIVSETENAPASLQFNKDNDVQLKSNCNAEEDLKLPDNSILDENIRDQNSTESDGPSSLASSQNIAGKALSQPQVSDKRWHQRNYSNKFGRDSKFGFRGHSHKRQHRERHSSPQRIHQRSAMPVSEDHGSHHGSSQNPQTQGGRVRSTNSQQPMQPVVYPQPQIPQYSLQNNDQQLNLQNNQAYNEAWQYYYYQQQMQLMWQQQMLQHQQLDPQQQQQQLLQLQYQQQMLQMQYFQQQQLQQGQQSQLSYDTYQQQQLSQAQQPHEGQQEPYQLQQQQQHLLYLQQQQQQQQYHQQQTVSTQQDPHGHEQGQSKQQTDASEIQDGVVTSGNAEPQANVCSASPHPVSPKSMG